jgi:diacylglycerol kinase family enzyme
MTASAIAGPERPVLLINPRSGDGKAQRFDLVAHCRARGIEPVVMKEGDDLASLAALAVSSGADVIGMAGGDGSQAIVAAVASTHDVPYVCVPAGTRNHFALDIGLNREDVIGALEAFHHGSERRIDLAQVNGRVFVNNTSIGLYGAIVQSPEYRDAKLRTVIEMLPDLLGPSAEPFDLRFTGPDGAEYRGAQLVLVSNNRYELDPVGAQGTRGKMNHGTLGVVVAAHVPFGPWREWTTPSFEVNSASTIETGVDGEALALDPPLRFEVLPSSLRIRVPFRRRKPRLRASERTSRPIPGPLDGDEGSKKLPSSG